MPVTRPITGPAPAPRRRDPGTSLIDVDPWLEPYADALRGRHAHYCAVRDRFDTTGGLLGDVSQGHRYFGFNRGEANGKPGVWYREWAPSARSLSLIGDFNDWDRHDQPLERDGFGVWSLFLPDEWFADRFIHGSKLKVHVVAKNGAAMDRIPAYIRRVVQEKSGKGFVAEYWEPRQPYAWRHAPPVQPAAARIYEAHVGMSSEADKVSTYAEFARDVLPRIRDGGYNTVQLMAVQEHPYYGSFGYHVSNFFAVSSRFGTPDDLKALIDTAHGMGIRVVMDLVHSHAVKNTQEGLNRFDGTDYQYFHSGPRGLHAAWDSLCFDYSKYEVQRFLLSNVRFWLEEYRFDGFRFDGVTSMIYLDHGLGRAFGSYDQYFDGNVDRDAVAYLQLANEVAHGTNPEATTIAEDVSGMAGMARPVAEGGLGFDYRLAMGVPDFWIKTLKEKADEQWSLADIWRTLLDRRRSERHIGYAESHDQSLVGDKTIAFWLMDKDMYFNMSKFNQNLVVSRGVALHKLIRLTTFSLAGEGYLNFIGNEFGHPEWVDFPREGNGYSHHHARRQWSLADDDRLLYKSLGEFDRAMMRLDEERRVLADPFIEQLALHEDTRQLVYRRGPLVFACNFHATESYVGLRIPVPDATDYRIVLTTDATRFGGPGLIDEATPVPLQRVPMYGREQSVQVYLPSRTAIVLAPA